MKILDCKKDMKLKLVGAMPRQSYTDMAASIIYTEKSIDDIYLMPYNEGLVKKIVNLNHLAITEFDYFIFAVEGVSRVLEVQAVRKRHASFSVKSGRKDKDGKREFNVVRPETLKDFWSNIKIPTNAAIINGEKVTELTSIEVDLDFEDICDIIEQYYEQGVRCNIPEEDLRYVKPQGTEAKMMIAMNGHALLDFFKVRCCNNAQDEIRYMANLMLKGCKKISPDLFGNAGAACVSLGYCPENSKQHKKCKNKVITHDEVKVMIKNRAR